MNRVRGRKVVAISMPQWLFNETAERLQDSSYSSMSEYIRDLIRKDAFAERLAAFRNDPREKARSDLTPAEEY